jgi:hypothetical protein
VRRQPAAFDAATTSFDYFPMEKEPESASIEAIRRQHVGPYDLRMKGNPEFSSLLDLRFACHL